MTQPLPKFDFDRVFSADGEVLRDGQRVKQILTVAEVEEVRQQAYADGEHSETAKAAAVQADAVRAVASQMQLILSRLETESETLRSQSAQLALAAASKLAGAAIAGNASEAIAGFCASVMKDLRGEPRFNVHCAEAIAGPVAEILEKTATDAGFDGAIIVRANPEITGADCRLEWGAGSVERSQADIEARIDALIADWLAAPEEEAAPDRASDPDGAQVATG
jgi:flagellar assembly protein FliH